MNINCCRNLYLFKPRAIKNIDIEASAPPPEYSIFLKIFDKDVNE